MARRAFRIGSRVALVLGTLVAAVTVVVTGTLTLTGRATYPVKTSHRTFSIHDQVAIPVTYQATVCQKAGVRDTLEQQTLSDCLTLPSRGK